MRKAFISSIKKFLNVFRKIFSLFYKLINKQVVVLLSENKDLSITERVIDVYKKNGDQRNKPLLEKKPVIPSHIIPFAQRFSNLSVYGVIPSYIALTLPKKMNNPNALGVTLLTTEMVNSTFIAIAKSLLGKHCSNFNYSSAFDKKFYQMSLLVTATILNRSTQFKYNAYLHAFIALTTTPFVQRYVFEKFPQIKKASAKTEKLFSKVQSKYDDIYKIIEQKSITYLRPYVKKWIIIPVLEQAQTSKIQLPFSSTKKYLSLFNAAGQNIPSLIVPLSDKLIFDSVVNFGVRQIDKVEVAVARKIFTRSYQYIYDITTIAAVNLFYSHVFSPIAFGTVKNIGYVEPIFTAFKIFSSGGSNQNIVEKTARVTGVALYILGYSYPQVTALLTAVDVALWYLEARQRYYHRIRKKDPIKEKFDQIKRSVEKLWVEALNQNRGVSLLNNNNDRQVVNSCDFKLNNLLLFNNDLYTPNLYEFDSFQNSKIIPSSLEADILTQPVTTNYLKNYQELDIGRLLAKNCSYSDCYFVPEKFEFLKFEKVNPDLL